MTFLVSQLVGLASQESAQFFGRAILSQCLGHDDVADCDVYGLVLLLEHLGGQAHGSQLPAYQTQEVVKQRIVSVKKDGNHRFFDLLDKPYDVGLPLAVFGFEIPFEPRHGPCGEESERVPVFDLCESFTYSIERDDAAIGVGVGVYGDEIVGHGLDVVENPVDHDFVVGAAGGQQFDDDDTVEGSERVVGYGDKRTFGQMVEHLLVVYLAGDVEIVDNGVDKVGSPQFTMASV